jgi:tetratricopeptide (TPR) repeat protein
VIDRALTISPKSFTLWGLKAKLAIAARGDLTVAERGLAELDQEMAGKLQSMDQQTRAEVAMGRAGIFSFRGKYAEALQALLQLPQESPGAKPHGFVEARLLEGSLREKLGQTAEAQAAFLKAKEAAQAALRDALDEPSRHAMLARALAHLGEKEAAISEAKRAIELRPESADAFEGPGITEALAEVYTLTGENAKAIEVLDGLLSRPGELTVPLLKIDPVWDRLRGDPAFQAMLAKH